MNKEIREIRELLEKALEVLSWCQENADEKWMVDHLMAVRIDIDQALTLLKQQPESRYLACGCILCICEIQGQCQGCGAKFCPEHAREAGHYTDCQQPTAGEFTKDLREIYSDFKCPSGRIVKGHALVLEACDRLDTAEAINKELLEACEGSLPFVVAHDITNKTVSGRALKIQAVIAKAKRDRE